MYKILLPIVILGLLLTSCASCKYCTESCYTEKAVPYMQYMVITKAPRPADAKYVILDEGKQIYDFENMRFLGYNIVEMKRLLKDMTDLVVYYEKISDDFNAENERLREEAEKAAKEHNEKVRPTP